MMKQFEVNTDDPPSIADRLVSAVRFYLGLHLDVVLPIYNQAQGCIGIPVRYAGHCFKFVGDSRGCCE